MRHCVNDNVTSCFSWRNFFMSRSNSCSPSTLQSIYFHQKKRTSLPRFEDEMREEVIHTWGAFSFLGATLRLSPLRELPSSLQAAVTHAWYLMASFSSPLTNAAHLFWDNVTTNYWITSVLNSMKAKPSLRVSRSISPDSCHIFLVLQKLKASFKSWGFSSLDKYEEESTLKCSANSCSVVPLSTKPTYTVRHSSSLPNRS